MVYYRKYRPGIIDELDNEKIREKLYSVLSSPSIPHAFLFTGSKGLGKTSTARIVAKAVNCQRIASSKLASSSKGKELNAKRYSLNVDIEPCNECSQCLSITNGSNLDVLEIDGASNRGIDEIRDLREKIRLLPAYAKKKVYIIDEVHMLTTEAFNALLKTLEEPPAHAMLILCTTELQKVPETISSRCLHVAFTRAKDEELKRSFSRIVRGEKIKIDDGAILAVASLSDGSFRDGAKILEELVFLSKGEPITKKVVEEKYQISNIKYQISEMINSMVEKDIKKALALVSKLVEQGTDMKIFIEQMINTLHEQLLINLGVSNHQSPITRLAAKRANHQSPIEIKRLIELLSKAHGDLKFAVLTQLPLELAIMEYVQVQNNATSNVANADLEAEKRRNETQRSSADSSASFRDESHKKEGDGEKDIMRNLIEKIKLSNQSIAGVLRSCLLRSSDEKEAVIEASYKFHKEKLEEKKTLEILEKAWEDLTGNRIKVVVELKK